MQAIAVLICADDFLDESGLICKKAEKYSKILHYLVYVRNFIPLT
jgi:hypothetical protein